ncbi:SMI1/KNR4 family protein [Streptomyces bambusae]|uniref:SMI1/KNR4 family protein n=1 Tax=Streptomyces bambusae TaxID=1550616 RepID=A0ABS6Z0V7_9ACTN|nr:SMI1/KNR4 family protein [Streptomyces bambusae]
MLSRRNGFYAFLSALHVFPAGKCVGEVSLEEWNAPKLWRSGYPGVPADWTAFAEDVFGGPFFISAAGIHSLDPETGELEFVAQDLEGWCAAVLEDPEVLTGYPLAEEWQERNGRLPSGMRLVPATPFVLGGEFSVENLVLMESAKALRLRAELASKIAGLEDGQQIVFRYE